MTLQKGHCILLLPSPHNSNLYMLPRKARTNNTIIICWPLHLLPSETLLLLRHQLFSSIKCTNLLWTTLHIALYTTDVKNIQWKASALHTPVLLFFRIGTTYYTFSSLWGNHPIPQTPIEEAASEVRTPEHCRRPSWLLIHLCLGWFLLYTNLGLPNLFSHWTLTKQLISITSPPTSPCISTFPPSSTPLIVKYFVHTSTASFPSLTIYLPHHAPYQCHSSSSYHPLYPAISPFSTITWDSSSMNFVAHSFYSLQNVFWLYPLLSCTSFFSSPYSLLPPPLPPYQYIWPTFSPHHGQSSSPLQSHL